MNKNFEIIWSEKKKTTTGKDVISATLKDESGAEFEKVSIWGDFPNWDSIMTGHKVTGVIYTNDKGYKTLYPPKQENASTGQIGGNKSGFGAGMMKAKQEGIQKSQENKELGIRTSSTIRMAVDLAIAENTPTEARIKYWRSWLVGNWDIQEPTSPIDIDNPPNI